VATDTAGNSTTTSAITTTVDTTAPSAPSINAATLGSSWQLSGTAEANSTVAIFDGSTQLGTVSASVSGTWSFSTGLSGSAVRDFPATATDSAGNNSPASIHWLEGTSTADSISAGASGSVIVGNGGGDTLNGGAGADKFVYSLTGDSTKAA